MEPHGSSGIRLWVVLGALIAALALLMSATSAEPIQAQADVEPQIVGGTPVDDGQYPFMAALYNSSQGPPSPGTHFCGGTLIDQDSVLTAAHCLEDEEPSGTGVTVGRTVLSSNQGYVRGASRFYVHPMYDSSSNKYDVGVIKLDAAVPGGIEPIKPADATQDHFEEPGRILVVTGWGRTETALSTDRMRKARVPVVSDSEAAAAYNSDAKKDFYPMLMVAAGDNEKDTCYDDSGGPLFERNEAGKFIQVGITSFGPPNGCAIRGYPGVYTEVNESSISAFIRIAADR